MTTYTDIASAEPLASTDEVPTFAASAGNRHRGSHAPQLRHLLVLLDLIASVVGWRMAQLLAHGDREHSLPADVLFVGALAGVTVGLAAVSHLYRARVCSLRSVEIQRLARVALAVGALALFVGPRLEHAVPADVAAAGTLFSFLLATMLRGGFRGWLQSQRKEGLFLRRVVLVGANAEARHMLRLVDGHPEAGYTIVGIIGTNEQGAAEVGCPYLGELEDTVDAVRQAGANGVIIAATAWSSAELNELVRRLLENGLHIHLSTGMQGIAATRLRPLPLAYEPLLYIESIKPAAWRRAVKRALDLVVASLVLLVSLPLLLVAAIGIKLQDGGPVLFRQRRMGAGGHPFTMLKLRTMTTDAESRYAELAVTNAGRTGPLVKLVKDPRITRIGRFLRASSIDELPQLLNVLGGSMSVVGPRPNLLVEAEAMDPLFLAQKTAVRPGITGLWQVEARDNPSFEEYRRYDIYYLENWTVGLDAAIMLSTAAKVISRAVHLVRLPSKGPGATVGVSASLE